MSIDGFMHDTAASLAPCAKVTAVAHCLAAFKSELTITLVKIRVFAEHAITFGWTRGPHAQLGDTLASREAISGEVNVEAYDESD